MRRVRIRTFARNHRVGLALCLVFTGLSINVWVQNGLKPFLVLLGAGIGCGLVIGSVGWLTGSQVVKHAKREESAIVSGRRSMEELTK